MDVRFQTECGECKKPVVVVSDKDDPTKLYFECKNCGHCVTLTVPAGTVEKFTGG